MLLNLELASKGGQDLPGIEVPAFNIIINKEILINSQTQS